MFHVFRFGLLFWAIHRFSLLPYCQYRNNYKIFHAWWNRRLYALNAGMPYQRVSSSGAQLYMYGLHQDLTCKARQRTLFSHNCTNALFRPYDQSRSINQSELALTWWRLCRWRERWEGFWWREDREWRRWPRYPSALFRCPKGERQGIWIDGKSGYFTGARGLITPRFFRVRDFLASLFYKLRVEFLFTNKGG